MKKKFIKSNTILRLALVLSIFRFLMGCTKQPIDQPVENRYKSWKGTASFKRNGIYYEGKAAMTFERPPADTNKFIISVVRLNNNILRDAIRFGNIPIETHSFPLKEGLFDSTGNVKNGIPYTKYTLHLADGDALIAYRLLETQANTLKIDSYDSVTKEIAGTFDVSFISLSISNPDTVRFTEGKFKTIIQ